jgi:hypothetical protein
LAIAVSAVAVATTMRFDLFEIPFVGTPPAAPAPLVVRASPSIAPPAAAVAPEVQESPPVATPDRSKVVRLRSSAGFDLPAKRVGTWSVSDPRFGKVSVVVPVGTTPRDALVIALAERGYQVVR